MNAASAGKDWWRHDERICAIKKTGKSKGEKSKDTDVPDKDVPGPTWGGGRGVGLCGPLI